MIQIKRPTTIYLNIGGFNIKIKRIPRIKKVFHDEPILDINNLVDGFLIKKPKTIDHTIIIEKNPQPLILQKKKEGKMNNLLFFYQEEGAQTRTFSYISEFQFKFILSGIIFKLLSQNGGFVLHASGVCQGNRAILFTGRSGAGKSTAVKLLRSKLTPIADDSIIIRRSNNGDYRCYQTPFPEKNKIERRKKGGYMISKILFLKKSAFLKLAHLIEKQSVWGKLLKQLFTETQYASNFFKNLLKFVNAFDSFYVFSFFLDKEKMTSFFYHSEPQRTVPSPISGPAKSRWSVRNNPSRES